VLLAAGCGHGGGGADPYASDFDRVAATTGSDFARTVLSDREVTYEEYVETQPTDKRMAQDQGGGGDM
jgi:hypothetical protein